MDFTAEQQDLQDELDLEESPERGAPVVYLWRVEQLERAGYSVGLAQKLAEDHRVDLHVACDLLGRGCPEHVAYSILA